MCDLTSFLFFARKFLIYHAIVWFYRAINDKNKTKQKNWDMSLMGHRKKWALFFLFSSVFPHSYSFQGHSLEHHWHTRGVLITQKHRGILQLPRPWSHLITGLLSRFPLVISDSNLCGYCLLQEARPHILFSFVITLLSQASQAVITSNY